LKSSEAQNVYASQGHEVSGSGPEEYAAFLKAETAKWAHVAKVAGIPKQ
jgi:tripartite-type tricarboxylate transporter receptor subunit TctC